jgi:hypothetical protein
VLDQFEAGATPNLILTAPGSEVAQSPQLSYSATTGSYTGRISVSASAHGTGRVQVVGSVGGGLVHLQTTYRVQEVIGQHEQDVFADDGNLRLHLGAGSLPGSRAYLVVQPAGTLPGPLPAGLTIVGQAYRLSASGALVELNAPGVLSLHVDRVVGGATQVPIGVRLYRWEPNSERWQAVASEVDADHQVIVGTMRALGTYALLAPAKQPRAFLPLMRADRTQ